VTGHPGRAATASVGRVRHRWAIAAALCGLLSCGGEGSPSTESGAGSPETTAATATTTLSATTASSRVGASTTGSTARSATTATTSPPLDGPRAGARKYVDLYLGGGGVRACGGSSTGPPEVAVLRQWSGGTTGEVEIGANANICFYRFSRTSPLEATVTLPTGVVRRFSTPSPSSSDGGYWAWSSLPGDPVGTYSVTATQGSATATTTFQVVPPGGPRLSIVDPHSGRPGMTLQIILAGFIPNSTVPIDVYQPDPTAPSPQVGYSRSFTVQVDGRGSATSSFTTRTTDGEGCLVFAGTRDGDVQCTYSHFHLE
jgi:hypothetical protein